MKEINNDEKNFIYFSAVSFSLLEAVQLFLVTKPYNIPFINSDETIFLQEGMSKAVMCLSQA